MSTGTRRHPATERVSCFKGKTLHPKSVQPAVQRDAPEKERGRGATPLMKSLPESAQIRVVGDPEFATTRRTEGYDMSTHRAFGTKLMVALDDIRHLLTQP